MSFNPNFSGVSSAASSQAIHTSESNNSGSTITKLTPVRIDASGNMALIDVSVEVQALAIAGIVDADVSNSSSGNVVNSGRISDITTSASLGDVLYVSKTGGVTNTKPAIGVDGFLADDFVLRLGIVAKNPDNGSLKDLLVNISIVGQL
jgi:hypothetical protein